MRSVLFDLDGTLLGLDLERFIPRYFDELVRFADHHLRIPGFPERLVAGVQAMLSTRERPITNAEAFSRAFARDENERRMAEEVFQQFYREEFPKLRSHVEPMPHAAEIVDVARRFGYRVALATNPVFPRAAVTERLRWAGLAPTSFDHITSYENCHFAKPDSRYFVEVALALGIHPETAIMIGNDTQEDGAAKSIGMSFWLVRSPYTIERPSPYAPDRAGSLAELTWWLEAALRGL